MSALEDSFFFNSPDYIISEAIHRSWQVTCRSHWLLSITVITMYTMNTKPGLNLKPMSSLEKKNLGRRNKGTNQTTIWGEKRWSLSRPCLGQRVYFQNPMLIECLASLREVQRWCKQTSVFRCFNLSQSRVTRKHRLNAFQSKQGYFRTPVVPRYF